jgi:hypothetical protein
MKEEKRATVSAGLFLILPSRGRGTWGGGNAKPASEPASEGVLPTAARQKYQISAKLE